MNTINKIFCVLMTAAVIVMSFAFANAMHNNLHNHNNSDTTIIRAAEIVPMTPATDDDGIGIVLQEVYFIDGEPMLYGKHVDFDAETADFVRYLLNNPDAKWIEPILNEDGSITEKIVDYLPFAAVAYDDGDRYWVELD